MMLSIILLTWNSERHVEKCINSILKGMVAKDYEIIAVDNGSVDNTLKIINTHFPAVKLIRNTANRGVAPARNQGINAAQGEYILILDIDTCVYNGAIDKLLEHIDKNLGIGLCGPRLCFEDGSVQNSYRRFPLLQTKLLRRINTVWAKKLLKNEYYGAEARGNENSCSEALEVDYVIGACQMIRRSALDKVGLLDDKIFYGPEDVDLCLRMWLNGWKVVYLPNAKVTHYEQRITKSKVFSYISIKHMQGLLRYFMKHRYLFSREKLYKKIEQTLSFRGG